MCVCYAFVGLIYVCTCVCISVRSLTATVTGMLCSASPLRPLGLWSRASVAMVVPSGEQRHGLAEEGERKSGRMSGLSREREERGMGAWEWCEQKRKEIGLKESNLNVKAGEREIKKERELLVLRVWKWIHCSALLQNMSVRCWLRWQSDYSNQMKEDRIQTAVGIISGFWGIKINHKGFMWVLDISGSRTFLSDSCSHIFFIPGTVWFVGLQRSGSKRSPSRI